MKTRVLPILFAVVGLTAFAAVTACTTVSPSSVASRQASFDGNDQTSGVLAQLPDGIVVTDRLRSRYNALITIYGRDFLPELQPDTGLTRRPDGSWLFARQNFIQFLNMNAWHKAGFKPQKP